MCLPRSIATLRTHPSPDTHTHAHTKFHTHTTPQPTPPPPCSPQASTSRYCPHLLADYILLAAAPLTPKASVLLGLDSIEGLSGASAPPTQGAGGAPSGQSPGEDGEDPLAGGLLCAETAAALRQGAYAVYGACSSSEVGALLLCWGAGVTGAGVAVAGAYARWEHGRRAREQAAARVVPPARAAANEMQQHTKPSRGQHLTNPDLPACVLCSPPACLALHPARFALPTCFAHALLPRLRLPRPAAPVPVCQPGPARRRGGLAQRAGVTQGRL